MSEPDWLSVHLFYQGDLDPLLTGLAGPVSRELSEAGLVRQTFFLRYWDGGPHVRWRLRPTEPDAALPLRTLLRERCQNWLAARPSPTLLDAETYERSAGQLARWERTGRPHRLQPNNTMAFVPYVREESRYGTGGSAAAVEQHFTESTELALELLGTRPALATRDTAAFATIVLTWFVAAGERGDLLAALADQTANWTELVTDTAPGVSAPQRFAPQRESLRRTAMQLRRLVREQDRLSASEPFVRWARSIRTLHNILTEEIAAGRFTPPSHPSTVLDLDPAAQAIPVLDICAHLFCNRIGVRLESEGLLRQMAALTIAEQWEEAR
ncbi:lantibiotic dehydratase C-terminal domain-containing protein [Salinispora pacifica]|uniref:lantibiotic dehydratase C-terminal domain-containing protein n=1 Tax=Salinispora pacifica TaxID=351187 RepID=UPI00048709E9|nr:lantibiotic dehydratase C-terminal domain-containing protein [Salinispora pacifica]